MGSNRFVDKGEVYKFLREKVAKMKRKIFEELAKDGVRIKSGNIDSSINRALAIYLYTKGLTQSQIAKILGISQPAVSHYLRGKRGVLFDKPEFVDIVNKILNSFFKEKTIQKAIDEITFFPSFPSKSSAR